MVAIRRINQSDKESFLVDCAAVTALQVQGKLQKLHRTLNMHHEYCI